MDWQNKMNRIIEYLENRMFDEIDLEKAARHAGYSLWEYQRFFSFMTNTTIGAYIRKRKLSLAASDILTGDEKIVDIALKYGYESPTAFSRAFNQLFGISPSSVRDAGVPLTPYPRLIFQTNNNERVDCMEIKNNLQAYYERGYYVKQNEPVYVCRDIEKTIDWFRDVLGWYGNVLARDDKGTAVYGGVDDCPHDDLPEARNFLGFQLSKGEPSKGLVGCIFVQGLERLRQYVLGHGWQQISELELQPYGAHECKITTIDGSIIVFLEFMK